MSENQTPGGWDDTVSSDEDEVDTEPMALMPLAPVWGMGEAPPAPSQHLPGWRWLAGGLRAAFLRAPATGLARPGPVQLLLLTLLAAGLLLAAARLEVDGPAVFDWRAWLVPWWMTLILLWVAWFALPPHEATLADDDPGHVRGLGSWFVLSSWATLPAQLLMQLLSLAVLREWGAFDEPWAQWGYWAVYLGLMLWALVAVLRLTARFGGPRWRLLVMGVLLLGLSALAVWQFPDRPWAPDPAAQVRDEAAAPDRLALSQHTFEVQQQVWKGAVEALQPQRDGVVDVYGLVFAPYAEEAVFRRESTLVADVLRQRFDADGRVLLMLNHPQTSDRFPWATVQNLRRGIEALAARMDRENDLLVIYLTSHGAQDFKLAASFWPLEVEPVAPQLLRRALDEAGVRHRVVIVSACYSGGWVAPLANEDTLVMTAADADHTSYGCGHQSELTFFGRALFDEQLRQTHSFPEAFARAVPVIAQREKEAGKTDGFSNPQIQIGPRLVPVLAALEQRLDRR